MTDLFSDPWWIQKTVDNKIMVSVPLNPLKSTSEEVWLTPDGFLKPSEVACLDINQGSPFLPLGDILKLAEATGRRVASMGYRKCSGFMSPSEGSG